MNDEQRKTREPDHPRRRAGRLHGGALRGARQPRAAGDRGLPVGRPASEHDRRRELPRLSRRDHGAGDDERVPGPGRELRHPLHHRRRRPGRALRRRRPAGLHRRRRVRRQGDHPGDGRRAAPARHPGRARARRPRRLHLRRLRRRLLQGRGRRRDRRRRLGDGGLDLHLQVRRQADDRPPPRRVPRLEDHARPRRRAGRTSSFKTPFVPEEFVAGDDGKLRAVRLRNAETGETEELEVGGAFVAIGHIPRSELVAEQVDDRRGRLRAHRGQVDPDQPRRACSRSATSSTTPTARRSPPPAPAAWAPSTPSGTCATRRPRRRPTGCRGGEPIEVAPTLGE